MSPKIIYGVFIMALIFVVPVFVFAETIPDFPMALWGTVTINSISAPVSAVVRAYYGSTLAGEISVKENGIYGYSNPTKQRLLIKNGNGPITFSIESSSINSGQKIYLTPSQVIYFSSGEERNINLAFVYDVPGDSGGGGDGGGDGGGGGGSPTPPPTSSEHDSGDSDGDGVVGINDFNSLMISWGSNVPTADFNNDNNVDILDFNILMINWSL